jgi:RimJ/RimL family protein N-acetyltransferase
MSVKTAPRRIVQTPRLTLRPTKASDAPALSALIDDMDVARMTSAIPHPYEYGMAEAFICRMAAADADEETLFAIDIEGYGFAGALGFHPTPHDPRPGAPELGFWLGRPHWGQGYMSEAVAAALIWAAEDWGKRFVLAGHFADNPASGRVLVKAGFLYTGDVVPRMSLARGEAAPTRMMVWLA